MRKCHYCNKPGATYRKNGVLYHEICYERLRRQQREKYNPPRKLQERADE